jgi:2-dehydropantoate 2-reductase
MDVRRDIAIIGTGAVGGYYGALLQQAGFEVRFLLHRDYGHVRRHGLRIESPRGNIDLPRVSAYGSPREMPRSDLVILALKTTENHLLPDILPHVCKETGQVLTLQNGLGSEEAVAACIGPENILSGLCFLCSNKVGPGRIRHLDYGLITLGDYRTDLQPAGITPRLQRLTAELSSAGITAKPVEDLQLARWKKLVWNIPFNGLTVLHDALTDALLNASQTRALCRTLMEEVAAAARACARPIEDGFLDKMMADTKKMKPYATSMKLDHDRGRPMEVEAIYGYPLRAARAAGVDMPETEKLYRQLQAIDSAAR